MKKLYLSVLGMYIGLLAAFSQTTNDSIAYKNRKLSLDEINFVSGYYHQDGNNSAVTGGIGTENLTDFANTIELKMSKYDSKLRKHELNFELGVDHYTSASSDKIDPYTISSASSRDTRIYPSVNWNVTNVEKRRTIGTSLSYSTEFDYKSRGIGFNYSKGSKDNNREFSARLQAYFDTWSVIYPIELRTFLPNEFNRSGIQGYSPRNSYSASFSLSQIINPHLQLLLIAEPTYQAGLLATKYQRVYFTDGSEQVENLPSSRIKIPLGIRANFFLGDRFIIRSFYRYYQDDWGIKAHTAEIEVPVKLSPFFSISPFYRYYTQTAMNYFASYGKHLPSEIYYSSDFDLSKFNSSYAGANFRIVPRNGIFNNPHLSSLELRYGHYIRNTGLHSDQISLHLQFK